VTVPLSFLGGQSYRSTFVRDNDDGSGVVVEQGTHAGGESVTLALRAGGGFVARFVRETPARAELIERR
jgi:alpha-glucosidase